MCFSSIHQALYFYFAEYTGTCALPLPDRTGIIDKSLSFDLESLENYGTIAIYISELTYNQQFILGLCYGFKFPNGTVVRRNERGQRNYERLSDQEIAYFLNRDLKTKNWYSKSVRREKNKTVRYLDEKFRECGLVGDRLDMQLEET